MQIDPVYNNVTAFMSPEDKIDYCTRLIKDTEGFLDSCSRMLDGKVKNKYELIIQAARKELRQLLES